MANDDNQSDHSIGSLLCDLFGVLTETDGSCRIVGSGHRDIGRTHVGHEFSLGIDTLVDSEIERRSISVPTQSNPTAYLLAIEKRDIFRQFLRRSNIQLRKATNASTMTDPKLFEVIPMNNQSDTNE